MPNPTNGEDAGMKRMKLIVLALALVAVPAASRAQQPDTVKRDTVKKESTAEKIGRQTGTSVDKAAKTTQHNAKVLGKRTADNTKQGYKDTKSDVTKGANKAAKATKTNAKHLKQTFKKATADTIKVPAKPDTAKAPQDSGAPASPTTTPY
jgi:hypothetical protein